MSRFGGLLAILLVVGSVLVSIGNAGADGGDEPQYAEFYTPPDPLPPGQPGDLIRTEPSPLVLEPSGQLGAIMATGTRIMYRSTDTRGNPIAVTGTYFEPYSDWPGKGPRPLISYATIRWRPGPRPINSVATGAPRTPTWNSAPTRSRRSSTSSSSTTP